jgi:predicted O-methyltransferase YrrM
MIDYKIENVLKKIEAQERFEQENPNEIHNSEKVLSIGRDTGIFYNILLQSNSVKKILEIGMSVGYSTIWFADAITKNNDGKIITIDQDKKKIERAKKNFDDAGVRDLIEIRHGDAMEVLSDLKNEFGSKKFFDFVFIDADKERYIQYFDAVLPMLKPGGLIGADNILFPERFQKFTNQYVKHVRAKPNIRSVTIPVDNGEELSLKLR